MLELITLPGMIALITLSKMKAGSEDYFLTLCRYFLPRKKRKPGPGDDDPDSGGNPDTPPHADYTDVPGEPLGFWLGSGASEFGLFGSIDPEHYRRIAAGYHPTKTKPSSSSEENEDERAAWIPLVRNVEHPKRTPFIDLCVSPPKSQTVDMVVSPPWLRSEFERLTVASTEKMISFAESLCVFSRTGKAGSGTPLRGLLTAAIWPHRTNREGEPQWHWHVNLMNVVLCEDGETRALYDMPVFKSKMLLQAFQEASYAHLLRTELGIPVRRRGNQYEHLGVPQELIDYWSTRRKQILLQLERDGVYSARAANTANLKTRKAKTEELHRINEKLRHWQKVAEEHGYGEADVLRKRDSVKPVPFASAMKKVTKQALRRLRERRRHFSSGEFQIECLHESKNFGLEPLAVVDAARDYLHTKKHIVSLISEKGEMRYTTKKILREERRLLERAKRIQERCTLVKKSTKQDLRNLCQEVTQARSFLNFEQRAAIKYLLTTHSNFLMINGFAGTGKTTICEAAAEAWRKAGYNVVTAAPTGKASLEITDRVGGKPLTVTKLLGDWRYDLRYLFRHQAKMLHRAAKGKKTWRFRNPRPVKIPKNTVLIVDEAGMLSVRQQNLLLKLVEKYGCIVLLLGDDKQIQPVEGMSAFHSLAARFKAFELRNIIRQKTEWQRDASKHFALGDVATCLDLYRKNDRLMVAEDMESLVSETILHWRRRGVARPEENQILANTNELVERLNDLAQEERLRSPVTILNPRKWTEIVHVSQDDETTFQARAYEGDFIRFTRNAPQRNGIRPWANGSTGFIQKIEGSKITVRLTRDVVLQVDGREKRASHLVTVDARKYPHLRRGYASTPDNYQGGTAKATYCVLAGERIDFHQGYVQVTRHKEDTILFTTKALYESMKTEAKETELARLLSQRQDLRLASDLYDLIRGEEEQLLVDWTNQSARNPSLDVIVTKTEEEAAKYNDLCQRIRYAAAQYDWNLKKLKVAAELLPSPPTRFIEGDKVRFTEDVEETRAGRYGTVTAVKPGYVTVRENLSMRTYTLPTIKQSKIELGYAGTKESLQEGTHRIAYQLKQEPVPGPTPAESPAKLRENEDLRQAKIKEDLERKKKEEEAAAKKAHEAARKKAEFIKSQEKRQAEEVAAEAKRIAEFEAQEAAKEEDSRRKYAEDWHRGIQGFIFEGLLKPHQIGRLPTVDEIAANPDAFPTLGEVAEMLLRPAPSRADDSFSMAPWSGYTAPPFSPTPTAVPSFPLQQSAGITAQQSNYYIAAYNGAAGQAASNAQRFGQPASVPISPSNPQQSNQPPPTTSTTSYQTTVEVQRKTTNGPMAN